MRAMILDRVGAPLRLSESPDPVRGPHQLLLRVRACGVCRTDLHVVDGELTHPKLPLILGHQIVAEVLACGEGTTGFQPGDRVGVPWLGWACGICAFCRTGRENLCPEARFTGYHLDGGFAELAVADARFCLRLPPDYSDPEAAPLLCAGLIGYRALRLAGEGVRLGLYGFGAAGHLMAQVAQHQGRQVYAFVRPGDAEAMAFAQGLGCTWVGPSDQRAPEPLDAAILFAPVGALVPAALAAVGPGGTVVCAGIHMSDIPSFPYRLLWEERILRSVANLTRQDAADFLTLASQVRLQTSVEVFGLEEADTALAHLRAGTIRGAAVLQV
jgi:propanol-preferring alcohol dehydrogenase